MFFFYYIETKTYRQFKKNKQLKKILKNVNLNFVNKTLVLDVNVFKRLSTKLRFKLKINQ